MAKAKQTRSSDGRFKPDHATRNRAIGAASVVGLPAAAVGAALRFGLLDRLFPAKEGHEAPDLALDQDRPGADDRAPDAFRPDPTAVPTDAERESLRPAMGQSPTLSADRGEMASQGSGAGAQTAEHVPEDAVA